MQRFDLDMRRFDAGTVLTDTTAFRSWGDIDDLAYQRSGGRAYIASAGQTAGERILIHQGPSRQLDQSAMAIIDRSMPTRVGGTELGLILLWKTAGCDPDNLNVPCVGDSDAGDSNLLSQYLCQPADDESLGAQNHIRVMVAESIRVVEVSESGQSELASFPLQPFHRIVAVRVAHVDGDVLLWWNPTGVLEFPDEPIARVHTLLNASGRPGIISGQDGRFLRVVFEYRTEHLGTPVQIKTATQPLIDLLPVRLMLHVDESRPPMETGFQVAHFDDTLLPERQARESRIYLRDMRASLRPGHRYRATAWMRTVDDEYVNVAGQAFDVDGDEEDLALRDVDGNLVLPPGDTLPDGEVRSTVELLQWIGYIPREPLRTTADPARANAAEFMDTTPRGAQRTSLAPRVFDLTFILTIDERKALLAFFGQTQGGVLPFLWRHPWTEELIVVRFGEAPKSQGVENDLLQVTTSFIEEPRPLGTRAAAPPSEGESDSASESEANLCIGIPSLVPMYADPSDSLDEQRPMHREADLRLPDSIEVYFDGHADDWAQDPDFHYGGSLAAATSAMLGLWRLSYLGEYEGTSRHWHHLKITGTIGTPAWDATDFPVAVTRHLWEGTKTYTGDDAGQHTMRVRFSVEHGPGGARGALANIYCTTTETGTFNDGDTHDGVQFTLDDPAVFDGGVDFKKKCHPQMLVCASVPTTMESPAGFSQVYAAGHGEGVPYCYRVTPGTPWSSPYTIEDAIDNSVYGKTVDAYDHRTCTLGGGCPTSELFDWVVIENGRGDGLTGLIPPLPGWDEDAGGLDTTNGSSITCTVCDPGQTPMESCCNGHPEAARTGTQECWKTDANAAHVCCFGAEARLYIELMQMCVTETHLSSGPPDCTPLDVSWDYSFYLNDPTQRMYPRRISYLDDAASTDGRSFEWFQRRPDPLYSSGGQDLRNTFDDFNDNLLTNWVVCAGTWTETAHQLRNDGPASGSAVKYLILRYGPADDMEQIADFLAGVVIEQVGKSHGIAFRFSTLSADGDGYIAEYVATDSFVRVWRIDDGAKTLLGEVAVTAPQAGDGIAVLASSGRIQVFLGTVGEFDTAVLTVEDCTYLTGYLGLGTTVNTEGAKYDNFFAVVTPRTLDMTCSMTQDGWQIVIPERLMPGWKVTNEGIPPEEGGTACVDYGSCPPDSVSQLRFLAPSEINTIEGAASPIAVAPDYELPPDYEPCPGGHLLPDAVVIARIRVEDDDEESCTFDNEDEACAGFDLWHIVCVDMP